MGRIATPPEDRFWAQVEKSDGCWVWTGAKHKGYGQFTLYGFKNKKGQWRNKTVRAHRIAYEWLVGPIPEGLTIDHECKNHACVRPGPKHCVPKTRGENTLLGDGPSAQNKRKTHCSRNHEFTEENTIRRPGRSGRECRTCANERRRK
jgi:hypothetical protein